MSCITLCIVLESTGAFRLMLTKCTPPHLESVDEATEWLKDGSFRDWVEGYIGCCGMVLDFMNQRYHFYDCEANISEVGELEIIDRWLCALPGWRNWDVAYARGGLPELVEMVPQAKPVMEFIQMTSEDEYLFPSREKWFLGWDAQTHELTYQTFSGPWHYNALLSVIRQDLTVVDFGIENNYEFDNHYSVLSGLTKGPSLLVTLADKAPYPLNTVEDVIPYGIIVDEPSRRIRYWEFHTPPSIIDSVAKAWPGWQVERLPFGYAGHLAATGRSADVFVKIENKQLRSRLYGSGINLFYNDWIRESLELPIDPRGLRPVIERCIDIDLQSPTTI